MVSFAPSSTSRYIYSCSICKQFSSINTSGSLRHIGVVHSHEANFYLTCGIDGCPRNYHNYHSFRKLVRRHHPHYLLNLSTSLQQENEPENLEEDQRENLTMSDSLGEPTDGAAVQCKIHVPATPHLQEDEGRSFALFLLKTKVVLSISQRATDEIMNDVTEMVNQGTYKWQTRFQRYLELMGFCLVK